MTDIDRTQTALHDALANARLGFTGRQSLYAKNLTTGEIVATDSDVEVPTASVIKVPIMAALYHEIDRGRFSSDMLLPMQESDRRYGTGVMRDLTVGREFSLFDLCRLMIVLSDNTATRMLINLIGLDRINELIRGWGYAITELRYQSWTPPDPKEYAVSTAAEMANLLERLDAGDLLSPASTAASMQHLRDQQDHQQLPRWLPYHEHYQRSGLENHLLIWNKTGQMTGVRTDAAIFTVRSVKWVVASFTRDSIDHSYRLEHEGILLNARTGLALYDAWGRPALEKE
ncbi:MAG: serine hydrolase [Thermomicrobiales bacterium]